MAAAIDLITNARARVALPSAAVSGSAEVEPPLSLVRIFQPDLFWTTVQTTLVIGAFMCIYYSVNYWYPTLLREAGRHRRSSGGSCGGWARRRRRGSRRGDGLRCSFKVGGF